MLKVSLDSLLAGISAQKDVLGWVDSPANTEAMRNKGFNRTPEKRELLRRAEERAVAAGRKPILAHY